MKRDIGNMRHRVEIHGPVRISDGALGFDRSDQLIATVWASIRPVSSSEIFAYQHLEQRLTHSVTIRYRTDVEQGQYIKYDGRDLYIETAHDPTERKEFLKLMCREGGNL